MSTVERAYALARSGEFANLKDLTIIRVLVGNPQNFVGLQLLV